MSDDRLLNFLTARGSVRIEAMREVLCQLEPESEAEKDVLRTYRAARGMDMLGHAEYCGRSKPSKLTVAPACLARIPIVERCQYLLCGARSARTVNDIVNAAAENRIRLQVSSTQHGLSSLMPSKVLIDFDDDAEAQRLADILNIECSVSPPAWSLSCFALSIADFESSLPWRSRSISSTQLKFYNSFTMNFENGTDADFGFAQTVAISPSAYIIEKDREAFVSDWDYGRYWSHAKQGVACLQYDGRRHVLAVPERLPLPRLFARALCLCTGDTPGRVGGSGLRTKRNSLVFSGVAEEIASKVANKLDTHFIPHPIAHTLG